MTTWTNAAIAAVLSLTLPACLFSGRAGADDPKDEKRPSPRTQAVEFLRKNVVGRTVVAPPGTTRLDGGKIEIADQGQLTVSQLVETPNGFHFDVTIVAKAVAYDLGPDGKRVGQIRDWSGVTVMRYELREMYTTKALTGFARTVSATAKDIDPTGAAVAVQMSLRDGQLTLKEAGVLYEDVIAAGGKAKPGTFEATVQLSIKGERLQWVDERVMFDVDPTTLARTPTKDKMPTVTYREVDRDK